MPQVTAQIICCGLNTRNHLMGFCLISVIRKNITADVSVHCFFFSQCCKHLLLARFIKRKIRESHTFWGIFVFDLADTKQKPGSFPKWCNLLNSDAQEPIFFPFSFILKCLILHCLKL